ncbi:uncharacterized protein F5147DRAFT_654340 [Suillus discolor]|uniref:DUF6533 domain-containing protein n=1 Tax=Suillus discolor TaxID=1912936 RepID=A0A9P7F373_9AGAM|nr:uncharacterized protein F5147DRAFT_654340 [Suillus discolor]KAG2104673.1 hypothetical protein F5147DRAFT_654340 [Suillus discolor]
MTFISNNPAYWPYLSLNIYLSYWIVAVVAVVVYDWVLTLGQEIELIWVHYIGIPAALLSWTNVALTAMLGVIMIARLHAMYQGSRKILMFLHQEKTNFVGALIYSGLQQTTADYSGHLEAQ